jgi:hypothetical protein
LERKKERRKERKEEGKKEKKERKKARKNITFLYVHFCVAFLKIDFYRAKICSERMW